MQARQSSLLCVSVLS